MGRGRSLASRCTKLAKVDRVGRKAKDNFDLEESTDAEASR